MTSIEQFAQYTIIIIPSGFGKKKATQLGVNYCWHTFVAGEKREIDNYFLCEVLKCMCVHTVLFIFLVSLYFVMCVGISFMCVCVCFSIIFFFLSLTHFLTSC